MPNLELIVFDCDGVLVDSEPVTNRVFCGMLNELGVDITLEEMYERFVGHSMPKCLEIITSLLGAPPPENFAAELRERSMAALEAEVEPVKGVEAALDAIDLPCCVASSGEHPKIRLTLGKTGLLHRFEGRIFSAADVGEPKPAPDVYLHAAAEMGVSPDMCAVIEDTPVGVAAGVAAGMYVLGFGAITSEYRLREAGAHQVFFHMADLPDLFRAWRSH